MIIFRNVEMKYDDRVLFLLNLNIKTGKNYVVTGNSGTGKTTLIRLFAGLEKPTDFEQFEISTDKISLMFQENRLFDDFDAVTNITATCKVTEKKAYEVLMELLDEKDLKRPVHEFSGGMKRRVALVRAFLADSDLVLLDEPFAGLDLENIECAVSFIKKYLNNRTLVIAAHDAENLSFCEEISLDE